ncbi:hypothetical protein V1511DRAFT_452918, partial [Dipodascopsis uninucleata]
FKPPAVFNDTTVQKSIARTRRLERGFLTESAVKIVLEESLRTTLGSMTDPYELANLVAVPCVPQTFGTSILVGTMAGIASYYSNRNVIRANLTCMLSAFLAYIPIYMSCRSNLGQRQFIRKTLELDSMKGKA